MMMMMIIITIIIMCPLLLESHYITLKSYLLYANYNKNYSTVVYVVQESVISRRVNG